MTRARRATLLLLALAPLLGGAGRGRPPFQRAVIIEGPAGTDSLREVSPELVVYGVEFAPEDFPLAYRIQISTRADFATSIVLDTVIPGDTVRVRPSRPLPEKQPIYWRAVASTPLGDQVSSPIYGPRPMAAWLRLIEPNAPNGALVETRRPRFTWSTVEAAEPPGPWSYDLDVISVGSGRRVISLRGIDDTTHVPTVDLESNTSYRWQVVARLATGELTTVGSAGTFVVIDASEPLTTLLYQNFPNPFPSATSPVTCLWFDLHELGPVKLEIYDLRGHLVRRLLDERSVLPGRYGRGMAGDPSTCDPQFTWDGTSSDGRHVPAGVYLARLQAGGTEAVRRILFRGP